MDVEIRLFGPVRDVAGTGQITVELDDGVTLAEGLRALVERRPGLEQTVFEDDQVRDDLVVTCNGTHVRYLNGSRTVLSDGDVVRLTFPIVGG